MFYEIEQVGDITVVVVQVDALDASNVKEFKTELRSTLMANPRILMDLGKVSFIDSSGLGCILSCLREVTSAGGDLKLFNITKPVRGLLEMVRLHKIVDILNTRDEGISAFEG